MPFQPIPYSQYHFGLGSPQQAPHAQQIVSAVWPLAIASPPLPIEAFMLSTFYLPVAVTANPAVAGTPPTVCLLTPQIFLSGVLVFQGTAEVGLNALPTAPGWVGGNGSVNVSTPNPVAYYAGQTLQVGFQAQFDQAIDQANPGSGAWIVLAGVLPDPTVSGLPQQLPGSIGYDSQPVQLIFAP